MDITWQDWINSIYPIAASNNCILSSLKNKYPFPDHWIKKLVEWTIILVEFCLPVSATLKPVLWNVRSFLAIQWFQKDLQKQLCLPDHRGKKRGITHSRPHLMIDGYFHCSFFFSNWSSSLNSTFAKRATFISSPNSFAFVYTTRPVFCEQQCKVFQRLDCLVHVATNIGIYQIRDRNDNILNVSPETFRLNYRVPS